MSDQLPQTAEGALIRRARELAIPKVSIRAAAARAGISPEQWGNIERGYRYGKDDEPPRRFDAPAVTVAKMASAVGVTAAQMSAEGERPDVAALMDRTWPSLDASPGAVPAVVSAALSREEVSDAAPHQRAIIAAVRQAAARTGQEDPPGEAVFTDPEEIIFWDKPRHKVWTPEIRAWLLADIRAKLTAGNRGRGTAAGLGRSEGTGGAA